MLAVTTMTLDHHHWLRAALVSDISAITQPPVIGSLIGEELIQPYRLASQGLLVVSAETQQYGKDHRGNKQPRMNADGRGFGYGLRSRCCWSVKASLPSTMLSPPWYGSNLRTTNIICGLSRSAYICVHLRLFVFFVSLL